MERKKDKRLREIVHSANKVHDLGVQLLFAVEGTWDVDPNLLLERVQNDELHKRMYGSFLEQIAKKAEEILFMPQTYGDSLRVYDDLNGQPCLRPQMELRVSDARAWMCKFRTPAASSEVALRLAEAYGGGSLRVVSFEEDGTCRSYRGGVFDGYLRSDGKLCEDDVIPVRDFGTMTLPPWLRSHGV